MKKFYKNANGNFYKVESDEELGRFYLDDLVEYIYIFGSNNIGDNTDWMDDLTEESKVAIYNAYDNNYIAEAIEEYKSYEGESFTGDINDLVNGVYLDNIDIIIGRLGFSDIEDILSADDNIQVVSVQGYSQGDAANIVLGKEFLKNFGGDLESNTELFQTLLFDGYNSIDLVEDKDLTEVIDNVDNVNAMKFNLEYPEKLDQYMKDNYNALPIDTKTITIEY